MRSKRWPKLFFAAATRRSLRIQKYTSSKRCDGTERKRKEIEGRKERWKMRDDGDDCGGDDDDRRDRDGQTGTEKEKEKKKEREKERKKERKKER